MISFYYKCLRGFNNIKRFIKYSIFMRFWIGIDPQDTWSLDISLAEWLLPRLIYFKDNLHGFPGGLTEEKWNEILDKMIFSFDQIVDDKYIMLDDEEISIKVNEGLDLFRQYYFDLWD